MTQYTPPKGFVIPETQFKDEYWLAYAKSLVRSLDNFEPLCYTPSNRKKENE